MQLNYRQKVTFDLDPARIKEIKYRMLNWANQFSILLFLDNNSYFSSYKGYECLLAVGTTKSISQFDLKGDQLEAIFKLHNEYKDWLFGHISYDYKNVLEPKLSVPDPGPGFPLLHFFIPVTVCHMNREQTVLTIESFEDPVLIFKAIVTNKSRGNSIIPKLLFSGSVDQSGYLETITKLREHIKEGDCYEINYCTKGYCYDSVIDPEAVFMALNALSPAPFAAFYRMDHLYMMCASPERYLRKESNRIITQPIKGTARRDKNLNLDENIRENLKNDLKERAENVMIVDLMRNDLARCCTPGSVQVDELFGIYTFPQVHQMISTVSGELKAGLPFTDAIRYSFPMGSMTGAPKFKVMQLIDQYETSARGLFSGTVGYITPEGDFDFNVVIRSLFYDIKTQNLSYQTGGAITYDSDPLREWEEMRLKAWALEQIFK